jgi:hypothetical protein
LREDTRYISPVTSERDLLKHLHKLVEMCELEDQAIESFQLGLQLPECGKNLRQLAVEYRAA